MPTAAAANTAAVDACVNGIFMIFIETPLFVVQFTSVLADKSMS